MNLGPGAKAVLMWGGVVIVVAGLKLGAPLFVPLVTAAFITVISLPVVRALTARNVPRPIAIVLAVLVDVAILLGLGGLVTGSLNQLYQRLPDYFERLTELAFQGAAQLERRGIRVDPNEVGSLVDQQRAVALATDFFSTLTGFVGEALLVGLLACFMLFEVGPTRSKLAYMLRRPTVDLPRFANAAREMQTYLVVKSALSVVTGALCGGWVAICGVDFPLLWGLMAFLLNYVPTIGMAIATVPPVVVALIQFGPGSALLVLSGYGVINFTLGNVVEPRVMGRTLGLSTLVVFTSMIFWGWLWGPVGALLAVPLTMVIKIYCANVEDLRWAAVLLGSSEWFAAKRKEWEDPFEAEQRRSNPPLANPIVRTNVDEVPPAPPLPNDLPSLDAEDGYEGSGPRSLGEDEPEHETFRSA